MIILGSFLPWVRSGTVQRDSFEVAGVVDRLGPDDIMLLDVALSAWIVIPLLCIVCVVLYVLGLPRTSAGFAAIVSAAAGTIGLTTYVIGHDGPEIASAVAAGPLTTFVGGVVAMTGSVGTVVGRRDRPTAAERPQPDAMRWHE